MQTGPAAGAALPSQTESHDTSIALITATVCLVWCIVTVLVCVLGFFQLWRHYSRPRESKELGDNAPHITIIRPIKGLEPCLYECLASTFRQQYPVQRLHVRFCIASRQEPSLPILERLLYDFRDCDAQILVKDEDAALEHGTLKLGPNPKIQNMSRAYREAIGDIVWVIDCNVWVAKGVCGRMVARLHGDGSKYPNKFVHQLPLVVDTNGSSLMEESKALLHGSADADVQIRTTNTASYETSRLSEEERNIWSIGGGRLEELFMSSAHAKFYTAINTVLVAPCVIGKSTMFRRSHLDSLTAYQGIDYFSENICEDQLIGDILWKRQVPGETAGQIFGRHALCFGDLAIQPMANMSLREYWSRRVRWLRVRKFTVTMATLVEPGTESFLCSLYGAYAMTTLPLFRTIFRIPQTKIAFVLLWVLSVGIWCAMDWTLYQMLQSAASVDVDSSTPAFARPPKNGRRRPLGEWLLAWLGRETLAFPIWFWAFWVGTRVEWRGKKFWVGMDMKVHEIVETPPKRSMAPNGHLKDRTD